MRTSQAIPDGRLESHTAQKCVWGVFVRACACVCVCVWTETEEKADREPEIDTTDIKQNGRVRNGKNREVERIKSDIDV